MIQESSVLHADQKNHILALLNTVTLNSLIEHNAILAGGAVSSAFTYREINDLDVYFRSYVDMYGFLQSMRKTSCIVRSSSSKSILIELDNGQLLQVISFRVFETNEELFSSFDFHAVMGAYEFATENFVFHQSFFECNNNRRLTFNEGTSFPIVSMLRVKKYEKYGYEISKPEFLKILFACMALEIQTVGDLKEHVGGMYGLSSDDIFGEDNDAPVDWDNVFHQLSKITNEVYGFIIEVLDGFSGDWDSLISQHTGIDFL